MVPLAHPLDLEECRGGSEPRPQSQPIHLDARLGHSAKLRIEVLEDQPLSLASLPLGVGPRALPLFIAEELRGALVSPPAPHSARFDLSLLLQVRHARCGHPLDALLHGQVLALGLDKLRGEVR